MKLLAAIFLCLPLMGYGCVRFVSNVQFKQNCGGHLKRAADANSVDLAKQELMVALAYMEKRDLTHGFTSVLYQTPSEDVGFWYQNVQASYQELADLPKDASPLERSNVLMKLRETLLDSKEHGDALTVPAGIPLFPYNIFWAVIAAVSGLLACLGFAFFAFWLDE